MSRTFVDIVGKKFGLLTVVRYVCLVSGKGRQWLCVCECGKETSTFTSYLNSGNTKSCGCLKAKTARAMNLIHGGVIDGRTTGAFRSYRSMLQRCRDRSSLMYQNYGGRGIRVCDRWLGKGGFENFRSDLGERPDGYSLERVDVNGNYEYANCKWIPNADQARNTRKTVWFILDGKRMCQAEAARAVGVKPQNLSWRRRNGKSLPGQLQQMTT